jgi:hypothetical protein
MRFWAIVLSGAIFAGPALAREIDPAERQEWPGYSASLPACSDRYVLGEISDKFSTAEDRFWNTSLRIVAFENIRETAWRPWGLDTIPRRFCTGIVTTSDGLKRRIDFSVREGLSFLGASWGTEWCIVGLDREYAYAPRCKQAQP